jgi:type III secretion protein T
MMPASVTGVADTIRFFFNLYDRELIALLLTLPRFYAFLYTSQLLVATSVPRTARTAAILSLSIIVIPINIAHVDDFDRTVPTFALYFVKEIAIGFVLGYLVGWVFWAVQSAGALIDNQRGASIASSIDPLQGHESSPLGILFSQAFLTYIFTTGAVLQIFGLFYQSYVLWPATRGVPILSETFPILALGLADEALRFVVVLAGPIVAVMFLAEFALAIVSRFAPQVQVFVLAMPIKSALAIFMLIFYFSILLPAASDKLSFFRGYIDLFYSVMQFSQLPPPPEAVPQ